MNMRHDNYVVYTILYNNLKVKKIYKLLFKLFALTQGLLYMSSSFPQFSVDEIILRHGSQMSSTFSGTFIRKIPEQFFRKPEFSETLFRNVP